MERSIRRAWEMPARSYAGLLALDLSSIESPAGPSQRATPMKLATLRDGTRDGALVVVRPDGEAYAPGRPIAPTLQAALDDWDAVEPKLREVASRLESGAIGGEPLDPRALRAP